MKMLCRSFSFPCFVIFQLSVDCRHEICKRMLKFCRQQTGKKKKGDEEMYKKIFVKINIKILRLFVSRIKRG